MAVFNVELIDTESIVYFVADDSNNEQNSLEISEEETKNMVGYFSLYGFLFFW